MSSSQRKPCTQTSCLVLLPCGVAPRMKHVAWCALKDAFKCLQFRRAPTGEIMLHNDSPLTVKKLQVLWVNDNSLSRITNLDYNPTIKSLYAHGNRIGTLKVRFRAVRRRTLCFPPQRQTQSRCVMTTLKDEHKDYKNYQVCGRRSIVRYG